MKFDYQNQIYEKTFTSFLKNNWNKTKKMGKLDKGDGNKKTLCYPNYSREERWKKKNQNFVYLAVESMFGEGWFTKFERSKSDTIYLTPQNASILIDLIRGFKYYSLELDEDVAFTYYKDHGKPTTSMEETEKSPDKKKFFEDILSLKKSLMAETFIPYLTDKQHSISLNIQYLEKDISNKKNNCYTIYFPDQQYNE